MPAPILATKLYIPLPRPDLVPRPRLIQLLNEGLQAKRRLTLVSAPAGSGKTTLLATWLKQIDLPTAWLSLDEADNELPRFLAYLAAAFQQVDEQIGAPLGSAIQAPLLEDAITILLNEIALRTEPLILVLDDYHQISEPVILEMMQFILDHQPPQLHLAIITREDPDLPLAKLRARDQITEIRAWDLRFTQEETEAFLRGVMGLEISKQEVAALGDRTEGWVVGLQLAGLSMQRKKDVKTFIADFSGSHRHILDYLTNEVVQQQPESIRSFLLQTAILERLSGPLCDAVTGGNDSDQLLAHLEAANLFVIPLDDERRWYRYHHLFSDLLRSQLARSQPESIGELHRRASRWFENTGDIRAAVDHALQNPDLSGAGRLVEQHAIPKLYQGEVALVLGWYDRLPDALLETAPMVSIGKAWALALMQRGKRRGGAEDALQIAERALERMDAEEELRKLVSGHAASIRAFLLQRPALSGEKPEELIALAQKAQRLLPVEEKAIRSVNAMNIGYGCLALGDLETASRAFTQTLEDGLSGGNIYAAIYGPINLIMSALLVGRLQDALQLCETNIDRFNKVLAGQSFPSIGALSILKGSLLIEFNRLPEAEQSLIEGLDLIRWTGEYVAHTRGHAAMARLRALQGDQPGMLDAIDALVETWPEGAIYAQALQYRLTMRHWPDDAEAREDSQTWLNQSGIKFGELEVSESIDPISMASFEGYLNAGHVVAGVVKARPGAYPVEGVHHYLKRQQSFATARGYIYREVAVAIARALLEQATGKKREALESLEGGLRAAVTTGLFRVFVDEGAPMCALLEEIKPRLADEALLVFTNRLLDEISCGTSKPVREARYESLLSERELEVLRYLATGLTYEEIGQQLFLSLNTIQFHVKNIYGKLLVNKRVQAIEKARQMNLI